MKNKIKVGQYVRSNYRNRWIGLVMGIDSLNGSNDKDSYILTVKQLVDQTGRLIPKQLQKTVRYNMDYFEVVDKPEILND